MIKKHLVPLTLTASLLACAPDEAPVASAATAPPLVRLVEELRDRHVLASPLRSTSSDSIADTGAPVELRTLAGVPWWVGDFGGLPGTPEDEAQRARGWEDSEVSRGSGPSLALEAEVPRSANLVMGPLSIEPSHNYTLAGYVRRQDVAPVDGAASALLLIEEHDARGETTWIGSTSRTGSGDWEFDALHFTSGPDATEILVHACLVADGYASGTVWFDDLVLMDHGTEPAGDLESLRRTVDEAAHKPPWTLANASVDLGRDAGWADDASAAFTRKLRLGNAVRSAVLAPVPTEISLPVDLSLASRLDVDLGVEQLELLPRSTQVGFEIALLPASGPERILLREEISGGGTAAWLPRRVPLDANEAGARLVFRTTGSPDATLAPAAWGNPTLTRTDAAARSTRKIVLVSLDTLRADHLGTYGHELPTSPTIDALARTGTVFDRAFSPAPFTLPAHVSLFTSQDPSAHHVLVNTGRKLSSRDTTLAEAFQQEGIVTAGFHGGGYVGASFGFAEGFDTYERHSGFADAVDSTLEFLEARRDENVFVFLHTYDIHAPYEAPDAQLSPFAERFRKLSDALPDGVAADQLGSMRRLSEHNQGSRPFSADELELLRLLYDAGIRAADDQLARFLDGLERLGLRDDTLIVLMSDHGEEFMEHGGLLHGHSMHGELLRIPLIMAGPGIPAARRVTEAVGLVDIAPTLLAWLGAPKPASMEGRALQPAFRDRTLAAAPLAGSLLAQERELLSLVHAEHHYIHDAETGAELLFDLRSDPGEMNDLASLELEELGAARALVQQNASRLPGLHLVFRAGDTTGRLKGTIRIAEGRAPAGRRFFGGASDSITIDAATGVVRFDLEMPSGLAWLNLDFGSADGLVEMELFWNDASLDAKRAQPALRDGVTSLSPGRYRFRLTDVAKERVALNGDTLGLQLWSIHPQTPTLDPLQKEQLEQLRALGYLK